MKKEIDSHIENGNWELIKRQDIPKGQKVLPSVWAMRRKRRLDTQEVYKHKARLNLHGGKQELGVNYWETYSPVVQWNSIRLVLILTLMQGWATKQIDFIMAYPQAEIECPMYMEIPQGFVVKGSPHEHALLLKKNIYGQKQADRVWNEHLKHGLLTKLGFEQSTVGECVFIGQR